MLSLVIHLVIADLLIVTKSTGQDTAFFEIQIPAVMVWNPEQWDQTKTINSKVFSRCDPSRMMSDSTFLAQQEHHSGQCFVQTHPHSHPKLQMGTTVLSSVGGTCYQNPLTALSTQNATNHTNEKYQGSHFLTTSSFYKQAP